MNNSIGKHSQHFGQESIASNGVPVKEHMWPAAAFAADLDDVGVQPLGAWQGLIRPRMHGVLAVWALLCGAGAVDGLARGHTLVRSMAMTTW